MSRTGGTPPGGMQASPAPSRNGDGADLVRRAAQGDRASFDALYCANVESAWRLASAVAADEIGARRAVVEGLVHAVYLRRPAAAEIVPAILGGVYRSALDRGHDRDTGGSPTLRHPTPVASSFVDLPGRWRAAVWLTDVEGLDPVAVAAVLGVAVAMATQLAARGRTALATRMAHAGLTVPDPLGPRLRPLVGPVPTALQGAAVLRWHKAVADPGTRAPLTSRMGSRAQRNVGIAAVGVLALGLIGVGVMTDVAGLTGAPAVGAANPPGSHGRLGRDGDRGVTVTTPKGTVSASLDARTSNDSADRAAPGDNGAAAKSGAAKSGAASSGATRSSGQGTSASSSGASHPTVSRSGIAGGGGTGSGHGGAGIGPGRTSSGGTSSGGASSGGTGLKVTGSVGIGSSGTGSGVTGSVGVGAGGTGRGGVTVHTGKKGATVTVGSSRTPTATVHVGQHGATGTVYAGRTPVATVHTGKKGATVHARPAAAPCTSGVELHARGVSAATCSTARSSGPARSSATLRSRAPKSGRKGSAPSRSDRSGSGLGGVLRRVGL